MMLKKYLMDALMMFVLQKVIYLRFGERLLHIYFINCTFLTYWALLRCMLIAKILYVVLTRIESCHI
ncbi:hypothetical protein TNCT_548301 [Trichonephila clavata]|uniref:Uncharacterized protein n=1 Tax=Trichonephila clavata TaxID=2740835 RepID=A0A8X6F244_TRICU|nr:hypothetical protein TNCT_548301 [Trichonephila clavata]